MVSPFGLHASAQCNYSYDDLLCPEVLEGIFSFFEDITLAKIDFNRGEAGLKHHYCILGHCEQIHTYEYRLPRLPCKKVKNNTQV